MYLRKTQRNIIVFKWGDIISKDKFSILEYYCAKHNKFFDELLNNDMYDCISNNLDCKKCKDCLKIDKIYRIIKIVDGEIKFLNFII